jgi:antitoxin VapB
MAFKIEDPETDALARRVAAIKKIGLDEAVRIALAHELERDQKGHSIIERGLEFGRELRARASPQGKPADKDFRDSLYENF